MTITIKGNIITKIIQNEDVVDSRTISNTWTSSGLWNIERSMRDGYVIPIKSITGILSTGATVKASGFTFENSLNSIEIFYGTLPNGTFNTLCLNGEYEGNTTPLSEKELEPPLTVPSGFSLAVEWQNTLSGPSDYFDIFYNSIWTCQVNGTSIAPNSMGFVHSGGTLLRPLYLSGVEGLFVYVVYNGSIVDSNAYNNIATIQIRKNANTLISSTITPVDKPSEAEFYVTHRNTVTAG